MLFLLCILMLAVSVVVIPLSVPASRNEGTFGTFTAVQKDCDRFTGCRWIGKFESDDGRIHMNSAVFGDEELTRPGDQARAQKVPGDESLYQPNSRSWLIFVLGDVACLAYVIWWIKGRRQTPHKG